MDYRLEELGPDEFQKLVQALIVDEYQDVQCMPLRQPDGGRDALSFLFQNPELVFQVKYTQKVGEIDNPSEWAIDKIEGEKDNIEDLIDRGMEKYIFVTNVQGTSYQDTGDIDTVNEYISETFDIEAMCWWRSDIARRLDNNIDVKRSYPKILRGQDVLGILMGGSGKAEQQYSSTTKSFIRGQYEDDKKLKFRQAELDGSLLSLFIDVPLNEPSRNKGQEYDQPDFAHSFHAVGSSVHDSEWTRFARYRSRELPPLGAATLLLSKEAQSRLDRVILEGAPGQGKSTVVQYISQVHRIQILEKEEYVSLPPKHTNKPIRVPFKCELRDFASWLSGENPFNRSGEKKPQRSQSLESFISSLITSSSGGVDVKVEDFHGIIEDTPILLVLDGLDEVGNIDERREVVSKIEDSIDRIDEIASSLQVIVTTRPSSFSRSPNFANSKFNYLSLDDVNRELVYEYAEKWMNAKSLSERERDDISKVLNEKMSQPHVRELAKNPMQLTILLDLVQKKGVSLPDQRTSLYKKYMELFFDRESTKSAVVKRYRQDLIHINGFTAWLLHCRAEVGEGGAIKEEDLRQIIKQCVSSEERSSEMVDKLLRGVVLRVGALVQRVQGKYEFEVQPLREFFAAHYLYDTLPSSIPGRDQSGTLPDRFRAIAKNFYWSNVTRFFAGFLNTGQLSALYLVLKNLASDERYGLIRYPYELSARLLSDYAFNRYQELVSKILRLMFDMEGFRRLLSGTSIQRRGVDSLRLPEQGGRSELLERCVNLVCSDESFDIKSDVSTHLESEYTERERMEALYEYSNTEDVSKIVSKDRGIEVLSDLGVLSEIKLSDLNSGINGKSLTNSEVIRLVASERLDVVDENPNVFAKYKGTVFDGWPSLMPLEFKRASAFLGILHHPRLYQTVFSADGGYTNKGEVEKLIEVFGNILPGGDDLAVQNLSELTYPSIEDTESLRDVVQCGLETLRSYDLNDWKSSVEPWNRIVETSRSTYGTRWSHRCIAALCGNIRSRSETCTDASDVLDSKLPLCSRARYARLRAGDKKWWGRIIDSVSSSQQLRFLLLILFSTASSPTIKYVASNVGSKIGQLDEKSFEELVSAVGSMSTTFNNNGGDNLEGKKEYGPRCNALIIESADNPLDKVRIYRDNLIEYEGKERGILLACQKPVGYSIVNGDDDERILDMARRSYGSGVTDFRHAVTAYGQGGEMSINTATAISRSVTEYPTPLVGMADRVVHEYLDNKKEPVGEVAERDNWFSSQI